MTGARVGIERLARPPTRRRQRDRARVLLVEMVVVEDDAAPSMSKVMDLNMLSMTGGKERTASEYAELFEKTGFRLTNVIPTPSPMQIVEAVRV